MALPAPNLDDRRFQELVDDAKRLVQQRCPEWTDHNVSDPGVTLIETFAWMVEQLVYRLNRVPDRNYVKFLELIGVRLFPPIAARTGVTFWLSAPQETDYRIAAGTEVATPRTETDEPVTFATTTDLVVVPCSLERLSSSVEEGEIREHTQQLLKGQEFFGFDSPPKPGDVLLIGLSNPVPSCALALRFDCEIEGVGVDPSNPPLVWEAWDGERWIPCELDRDETGGLNRGGEVILHIPPSHTASVINQQRAGWVRCRLTEPEEEQPFYSASPKIRALTAFTIGGTVDAINAQTIEDEIIGLSEGVPGQRFELQHRPIVRGDGPVALEVASGEGWQEWTQVENFADSGPEDLQFVMDEVNGQVILGPGVRQPDGTIQQFGAVPPKAAPLRVRAYRTGGGARGNITRGAIQVVKTSIPLVTKVENRRPAAGGVDGEDIENAKLRGPILFRTRNRAVTAEDYEQLAREAAPEAARVRSVSASDGGEAGSVRILVVPAAAHDEVGSLRFEQLVPSDETLQRITDYLDERRVVGARVNVEPPVYQGITVVARLRARARTSPHRLQQAALEALYRYFDPIKGGPDGTGWPFGRPIQVGEVYSVLQRLRGIELVEDARL
ncbi:MAG TPA: putative baseplate assembly protein, partial [Actinomycetota bacterium]|nr:putative baseplate assembly protein [Actinomycetota bacterium]